MATARWIGLPLALALVGCAPTANGKDEELSPQEKAAYDQCLQDNMMVATAWEVIEQQCLDQVKGRDHDPLSLNPYKDYDWSADYEAFRQRAVEGPDAEAAALGDGFLDRAAMDLNYHNPDFGRLAKEVGAAHQRAGQYDDAYRLYGQAHGAFVFSLGYDDKEACEATGLLADTALAKSDLDNAVKLYQEAISMAVLGGHDDYVDWFWIGLADAYDRLDPRISSVIREARGIDQP